MLPWQIKRMLVIVHTLRDAVFLSITHFRYQVEDDVPVGGGGNLLRQLQLRPSKLSDRSDIPGPFLKCQLRLQDDHALGPADGHGLHHYSEASS